MIKLKSLKLNKDNPRIIKDSSFQKLLDSLKQDFTFLFKDKIYVRSKKDLTIGVGSQRYKALLKLGYKEIPDECVGYCDDLDDEQFKRSCLKNNIHYGEWDVDKLKEQFDIDDLINMGIEIDVSEFVDKETPVKKEELKPYKKTHVLLSFSPDILNDITELLEKIKEIPGIEYEQSAN